MLREMQPKQRQTRHMLKETVQLRLEAKAIQRAIIQQLLHLKHTQKETTQRQLQTKHIQKAIALQHQESSLMRRECKQKQVEARHMLKDICHMQLVLFRMLKEVL